MPNHKRLLLALSAAALAGGCADGVASTAPVHVSQADLTQSSIFRAKQALDTIEKLPANERQFAANVPKTAEALYAASQADSATKKRIEDLGLTISVPPKPRLHG